MFQNWEEIGVILCYATSSAHVAYLKRKHFWTYYLRFVVIALILFNTKGMGAPSPTVPADPKKPGLSSLTTDFFNLKASHKKETVICWATNEAKLNS